MQQASIFHPQQTVVRRASGGLEGGGEQQSDVVVDFRISLYVKVERVDDDGPGVWLDQSDRHSSRFLNPLGLEHAHHWWFEDAQEDI